eukprot:8960216-Pyramimonas_sp.AAC.1
MSVCDEHVFVLFGDELRVFRRRVFSSHATGFVAGYPVQEGRGAQYGAAAVRVQHDGGGGGACRGLPPQRGPPRRLWRVSDRITPIFKFSVSRPQEVAARLLASGEGHKLCGILCPRAARSDPIGHQHPHHAPLRYAYANTQTDKYY